MPNPFINLTGILEKTGYLRMNEQYILWQIHMFTIVSLLKFFCEGTAKIIPVARPDRRAVSEQERKNESALMEPGTNE